jgi:organic hydroperoxide reductase OsmC/OhrA
MAREMAQKKEKFVNGINVDQLFDTIDMVKQNPEIARFNFRATNQWIAGTHNQATVKNFYGAGMEDSSRDPMVFELDEPPVLCGTNLGANPVEYLLAALSGCLTTTMVAHAAARGIEIRKVESRYEETDLRGFLGYRMPFRGNTKDRRVLQNRCGHRMTKELVAMARKYSRCSTASKAGPVSVHWTSESAPPVV